MARWGRAEALSGCAISHETEGILLDRDERQNDRVLSIDKDAKINVVVNRPPVSNEVEIDLGRVFHNFKLRTRVFAWLLILCIVAGVCGSLLLYQFTKAPYTVTSVVTLKYEIPNPEYVPMADDPEILPTIPVTDLTAPDGSGDLDLNQITASNVLKEAVSGMELSQPVSLSSLRSNIRINRILTEDSRRQQEIAASMVEDKNNNAYTQVQDIQLTYDNRFVVSLTNGFGDDSSRAKQYLTDDELKQLLDRILDAYNSYLVQTYASIKLPDDEISVIDTDSLDILESLDLLRTATQDLYDYCDEQPAAIKTYRSWKTGRSLEDLMKDLETARDVNVDYLYSYAYTNSIVKDRKSMITNYEFQLRNIQSELDVINEKIVTTQTILNNYKNDEIFVSMQESDTAKSTQTTTDYYNELILQQSENYGKAAELETRISDLQDKINSLNNNSELADTEQATTELAVAMEVCHDSYLKINAQMQEIMNSAFYTNFADHSVSQGNNEGFLSAASKKMVTGAALGAFVALALWFLSALAPEFRRKPDEMEAVDRENQEREAIEA